MPINIEAMLSGGNPRTLGRTEEVVEHVLCHSDRLDDLFACVTSADETVRMRAGDALEKVCRVHPDWLDVYVDRLLGEVAAVDQPSVQWHMVQMIGKVRLTERQRRRAVMLLKHHLESATDWIVLNYTLEVFARFARADATLQEYFADQLQRHLHSSHKSVAKRAAKLLADPTMKP